MDLRGVYVASGRWPISLRDHRWRAFHDPVPRTRHQEISGNLFVVIWNFIHKKKIGKVFPAPYDVVFSRDPLQVVEPDLVFVSNEHFSIIGEKNIQGVPDLTVEILSPATATADRRVKHSLYERFGVCEYWIVDPESQTCPGLSA